MGPAVAAGALQEGAGGGGGDEVVVLGKEASIALVRASTASGVVTWPGRNSIPPGIGEKERKERVKNLQGWVPVL